MHNLFIALMQKYSVFVTGKSSKDCKIAFIFGKYNFYQKRPLFWVIWVVEVKYKACYSTFSPVADGAITVQNLPPNFGPWWEVFARISS